MSIVQPPPKKRSPLQEYYENYGKRRATDVSKWKITLTGALPGLNQSVQNNTNQTYQRSVVGRGCYSIGGLLLVAATVVIVVITSSEPAPKPLPTSTNLLLQHSPPPVPMSPPNLPCLLYTSPSPRDS